MAFSIMENLAPETGSQIIDTKCRHNEDITQNSILGSVNTGFGPENELSIQSKCTKKSSVLHLYKETYLSEFETEEEKARVRLNLGVPSVSDVNQQLTLKLANYATKADVDKVIAGTLSLQNYYTKEEMNSKLEKLDLNLDKVPTQYSVNGVTSGGVWKHVDDTVGAIHRYTQTI